jgi:aryl-alcohol dehydrogenase-like predicted oxidoreductase
MPNRVIWCRRRCIARHCSYEYFCSTLICGNSSLCCKPADIESIQLTGRRHWQAKLRAAPQIANDGNIASDAAAALQVARSTPYVITAIVGHKMPEHVDENLKVVQAELLERQNFMDLMQDL